MYSSIKSSFSNNTTKIFKHTKIRTCEHSHIKVQLNNLDHTINADCKTCTVSVEKTLLQCFDEVGITGAPFSILIDDGGKLRYNALSMIASVYPIRDLLEAYPGNAQWIKDIINGTSKPCLTIGYHLITEEQVIVMVDECYKILGNADMTELISRCKREYITNNSLVSELFDFVECGAISVANLHRDTNNWTIVISGCTTAVAVITLFSVAALVKTRDNAKIENKKKRNKERRKKRRENTLKQKSAVCKNVEVVCKGNVKDETTFAAKYALLDPVQRAIHIQHILQNHDDECMMCMEKYKLIGEEEEKEETPHVWICGHKVCDRCFKQLQQQSINTCIICNK